MLSTKMHSGRGGGVRKLKLIMSTQILPPFFVSIVFHVFSEFSLDIELSQINDCVNRLVRFVALAKTNSLQYGGN